MFWTVFIQNHSEPPWTFSQNTNFFIVTDLIVEI